MKPISNILSSKFKICSFIATIFVVYRHSFVEQAFGLDNVTVSPYLNYSTHFMSSISEVAVPIFFFISGFFFIRGRYHDVRGYKNMVVKKNRTLFIPFLIWNLIGLIVLIMSNKYVYESGLFRFLEVFFLSYNYGPLWYVRDLMLLMLLSPLYIWLFKDRIKWCMILFFPLIYYFWTPVDNSLLSIEGILFFVLGGCFSNSDNFLEYKARKGVSMPLILLWLIMSSFFNLWSNENLHRFNILLGVVSFWYLIDLIPYRLKEIMKNLSQYSFFIYVTHFYFVKSIKIFIAHFFFQNEIVAWCTFLLLPLLASILLVIVASEFKRKYNKQYSFLTGNR